MRFAGIAQRVDFAMVNTVLLEGVDTIKSAAEEDAAMMKSFEWGVLFKYSSCLLFFPVRWC